MAAYCVLQGIDYQVEECPMAAGNRHLGYKEALNAIEAQSPGAKAAFYMEFLDKASHLFTPLAQAEKDELNECASCGAPTSGEVCAFCRLVEKATTPRARR
jgi:tRNA-5-methyluridine54 2-sulfurtransferase